MVLNLAKEVLEDLTDKYLDHNLFNYQIVNRNYSTETIDHYAMHAIDQFKRFGYATIRPRLTLPQRQALTKIQNRIEVHWPVMKMVFQDDPEYKYAIGKAHEWCKVLRKESQHAPRNYHDLTKAFWACESFMLACDDYYAV